jgi:hypothetical protein
MSKETFSGTVLYVEHLKPTDVVDIERGLETVEISGIIQGCDFDREEKLNKKKDLIVLVIVP